MGLFAGLVEILPEFPELHALVNTTALIMEGTTLIPARVAAITKGDSDAVPEDLRRSLSLDGTISPTMKIESTVSSVTAVKKCLV